MPRKSPKRRRRALTEQEQEQLIMAVEGLTYPERAAFLKSKGYAAPWYMTMRRRYLTRHPELNLDTTPTPVAASPQVATLSFKDATKAQKFKMIAEYDTLPRAERQAWREAHGVHNALLAYYRKQFPSTSTALARVAPNGSPATSQLKRPQKPTNHLPYPPVLPPTSPQPLTVDDMINAFKVERDMLNETIAKMERMKASHQ